MEEQVQLQGTNTPGLFLWAGLSISSVCAGQGLSSSHLCASCSTAGCGLGFVYILWVWHFKKYFIWQSSGSLQENLTGLVLNLPLHLAPTGQANLNPELKSAVQWFWGSWSCPKAGKRNTGNILGSSSLLYSRLRAVEPEEGAGQTAYKPFRWKWSCSGLHAAQSVSSVSCKGLRVAEQIIPVLKTAWAPLFIAWLWNASLLSISRFSHLTRLKLKYLNFSEVNMKFHWNRHLPWHYFPELKMYQQQIFFPRYFCWNDFNS